MRSGAEIVREHGHDARAEPLGERGEAGKVGEQHRERALLAPGRASTPWATSVRTSSVGRYFWNEVSPWAICIIDAERSSSSRRPSVVVVKLGGAQVAEPRVVPADVIDFADELCRRLRK